MSKLNKYRWAKKSCYRGNSLTQYAIIIALIALLLVPVFLILGQNIVNYFAGLDKGLGERKNDHTTVSNDQLPANMTNMAGGSLGGTPDKPVEKCQDNECVIDFGEFVLSGVPENFSDYVSRKKVEKAKDLLIFSDKKINEIAEMVGINNYSYFCKVFKKIEGMTPIKYRINITRQK